MLSVKSNYTNVAYNNSFPTFQSSDTHPRPRVQVVETTFLTVTLQVTNLFCVERETSHWKVNLQDANELWQYILARKVDSF